MYVPQCPNCKYHQEHVYTFESDKKGRQWVIERCPNCQCAQWPDNPLKYEEYLTKRRRSYFEDETK